MAQSAKKITTVQGVKNLKVTGEKYTRSIDVGVKGFGVKVTVAGGKFYVLTTRWPGAKTTSQFTLGTLAELEFEEARAKAKDWHTKINAGIDPRKPVELASVPTFGVAAEAWLEKRQRDLRQFAQHLKPRQASPRGVGAQDADRDKAPRPDRAV